MNWSARSSYGIPFSQKSKINTAFYWKKKKIALTIASLCWKAQCRCQCQFTAWVGTCAHCQRYRTGLMNPMSLCLMRKKTGLIQTLKISYAILSRKRRQQVKTATKATQTLIIAQQNPKLLSSMPWRKDAVTKCCGHLCYILVISYF